MYVAVILCICLENGKVVNNVSRKGRLEVEAEGIPREGLLCLQ